MRASESEIPSEVVPHAHPDLLFVLGEELVLVGHAVEVVEAGPEDSSGRPSPLKAYLGGHVSAVVDLFSNPRVDGEERRAEDTRGLERTVVDAELEFPRFAPPFDKESPAGLGVKAQAFERAERQTGDEDVPGVVDPIECGGADHVFVAKGGAEVVVAEFRFQRTSAKRERNPKTEIDRDQVPVVGEGKPRECGPFD